MEQAGFRPDQKQAYGGARAGWRQYLRKTGAGAWRGRTEADAFGILKEVTLNWNTWIRQIHRWLSIAFTVAVIVNVVAMTQEDRRSGSACWPLLPAHPADAHRSLPVRAAVCRRVARRDAPADRSGDGQEASESREGATKKPLPSAPRRSRANLRQAGANAALGRQPADRQGLRRRAGAGLHRGHAGLEERRRPPPRRARSCAPCPACARR